MQVLKHNKEIHVQLAYIMQILITKDSCLLYGYADFGDALGAFSILCGIDEFKDILINLDDKTEELLEIVSHQVSQEGDDVDIYVSVKEICKQNGFYINNQIFILKEYDRPNSPEYRDQRFFHLLNSYLKNRK